MIVFIVLLAFISTNECLCQTNPLVLAYSWRNLTYSFPTPQDERNAIKEKKFIVGNAVPIDVDVYYPKTGNFRVFVTFPRFAPGTPITLATVTAPLGTEGAAIKAYPSYDAQNAHGADCDKITSVFRIAIDLCDRLWVLDSGKIGDNVMCPPQLLSYSLLTDKLLTRYKFPQNTYKTGSILLTPV